jgi:menaquinol-cytochrome c reductase iron-sulfur subunit
VAGRGASARRGFLGVLAALGLAAVAYLTPVLAALAAVLHPLRGQGQAARFFKLGLLDALPEDGTPHKAAVIADRSDAWTRFPREPIGSVFLRRLGKTEVEAVHTTCPHAGCSVGYDAEKKIFFCPCHRATFALDGKRLDSNSPSPRDLDTLPVKIEDRAVWVQFQNFRVGVADRKPV